jgi:hypothetical protein
MQASNVTISRTMTRFGQRPPCRSTREQQVRVKPSGCSNDRATRHQRRIYGKQIHQHLQEKTAGRGKAAQEARQGGQEIERKEVKATEIRCWREIPILPASSPVPSRDRKSRLIPGGFACETRTCHPLLFFTAQYPYYSHALSSERAARVIISHDNGKEPFPEAKK